MDSLDSHCLSEFKSQPHSLPAVCPDQSDPSFLCLGFLVCKHEDTGVKGIPQWRREVLGEGPACSRCSLGAPPSSSWFQSPCHFSLLSQSKCHLSWISPQRREPVFSIQAFDATVTARARGESSPPPASIVFCEPALSAGKCGSQAGFREEHHLPFAMLSLHQTQSHEGWIQEESYTTHRLLPVVPLASA